jgi:hypothetical protein
MDEHTNEVTLFVETNYSSWRIEMKGYLKAKGEGVWNIVFGGSVPSKNQSKSVAQKEEKKNNAMALNTIFNGLLDYVKGSIGKHSFTKGLWLKLEKEYQDKRQDT